MNLQEKLSKKYFHWFIGDNNIRADRPQYIANMDIGIVIRFEENEVSLFADFDEFYNGIADVQFIYGNRPDKDRMQRILIDAYNYMIIEDRILEQDLEDLDLEEDVF